MVDTALGAPHKPALLTGTRVPADATFDGGGVSRVAKGADCKSAGLRLRRFESYLPHQLKHLKKQHLRPLKQATGFAAAGTALFVSAPCPHPRRGVGAGGQVEIAHQRPPLGAGAPSGGNRPDPAHKKSGQRGRILCVGNGARGRCSACPGLAFRSAPGIPVGVRRLRDRRRGVGSRAAGIQAR